jgi:hypothetical protein
MNDIEMNNEPFEERVENLKQKPIKFHKLKMKK